MNIFHLKTHRPKSQMEKSMRKTRMTNIVYFSYKCCLNKTFFFYIWSRLVFYYCLSFPFFFSGLTLYVITAILHSITTVAFVRLLPQLQSFQWFIAMCHGKELSRHGTYSHKMIACFEHIYKSGMKIPSYTFFFRCYVIRLLCFMLSTYFWNNRRKLKQLPYYLTTRKNLSF